MVMIRNLLKETKEVILNSGHFVPDIIFIGSEKSGHQCTWEEFEVLADVDYDAGYGAIRVASDLIVVFSDGHKMWRGEYDGSEWWEYSTPFTLPLVAHPITCLVGGASWKHTLAEKSEA